MDGYDEERWETMGNVVGCLAFVVIAVLVGWVIVHFIAKFW